MEDFFLTKLQGAIIVTLESAECSFKEQHCCLSSQLSHCWKGHNIANILRDTKQTYTFIGFIEQ